MITTCSKCLKKWFCIAACPAINTTLSHSHENVDPGKKIVRLSWATR